MCLIKFFVILFFAKFFAYLNMTNSGFSFTQIPHHFGCRFWGIINVKFWMINVKFYKKLCHIIFHKFLSISRCVRPVTYASWLSKKVPCFLQLQLLRTFVYLVGGYRFILFCISIRTIHTSHWSRISLEYICKLHTSPSFLTRSFNLRGREGVQQRF